MTDKQVNSASEAQIPQDRPIISRPAEGGAPPVNPLAGLLAMKMAQKNGQSEAADGDNQKSTEKKEGSAGKPPRPSRSGDGTGNNAEGNAAPAKPKGLPIKITTEQFLNNVQLVIEKKKKAEAEAAAKAVAEGADGASSPGLAEKRKRRSSKNVPDAAGQPGAPGAAAAAAGGNPALKDALANLIAVYGKQPAGQKQDAGDTEAVAVFKKAFKLRLQKQNKIFSKDTNDILRAALQENLKAKLEYQKQRRERILAGESEVGQMRIKSQKTINQERLEAAQTKKKVVAKFLDHYVVVTVMTIITIYALFFDDLRVLAFPKEADPIFYAITLFGMICFTIEIILASYAKEEYLLSFFFWLDIISTLSMVPDIGWVRDQMFGSGEHSEDATDLAKTSRAGRVTRVVRVIRIVRLVRIVKLYKQAQHVQKKNNEYQLKIQALQNIDRTAESGLMHLRRTSTLRGMARDGSAERQSQSQSSERRPSRSQKPEKPTNSASPQKAFGLQRAHTLAPGAFERNAAQLNEDQEESEEDSASGGSAHHSQDEGNLDRMFEDEDEQVGQIPEESKISRILSDQTTKTVIILVLCLLFCLPAFTVETYLGDTVTLHDQAIRHLQVIYDYGEASWSDYRIAYDHLVEATRSEDQIYPLIYIDAADPNKPAWNSESLIKEWEPQWTTLRQEELRWKTVTAENGRAFTIAYSTQAAQRAEAIIQIARTLFIVIILAAGSILFTQDAQRLVLDPLERMIEKVRLIAQNPLIAASEDINQAGPMAFIDQYQRKAAGEGEPQEEQQYETAVLERAIVKIGHLLALGFGEAGTNIIGQNMKQNGELDAIMPGLRTYAVFGFCILEDFIATMEVLETDIMTYVNQVAEITHSMVDRYGGSANKNIGEAFLCVWKFPNADEIETMDINNNYNNEDISKENQIVADLSVFSFLKVIAKLNKYRHILKYSKMAEMKKKVRPDFKVKMGFGLHQGWAIEGAIGSQFKVDASYLSPNVNMAARLEAASKQFGTALLISGHLRALLSPRFQDELREIDTVTVVGSVYPMQLFTVDIQTDDLEPSDDPLADVPIREKKAIRDEMRRRLHEQLYKGETTTWDEFQKDKDIYELRKNVDQKYERRFAEAYKQYIAGDWASAGPAIQKLLEQRPKDGPVASLNRIINIEQKGVAPSDWEGWRALTSK